LQGVAADYPVIKPCPWWRTEEGSDACKDLGCYEGQKQQVVVKKHERLEICKDTPGWTNGDSADCAAYTDQAWCKGGVIMASGKK